MCVSKDEGERVCLCVGRGLLQTETSQAKTKKCERKKSSKNKETIKYATMFLLYLLFSFFGFVLFSCCCT